MPKLRNVLGGVGKGLANLSEALFKDKLLERRQEKGYEEERQRATIASERDFAKAIMPGLIEGKVDPRILAQLSANPATSSIAKMLLKLTPTAQDRLSMAEAMVPEHATSSDLSGIANLLRLDQTPIFGIKRTDTPVPPRLPSRTFGMGKPAVEPELSEAAEHFTIPPQGPTIKPSADIQALMAAQAQRKKATREKLEQEATQAGAVARATAIESGKVVDERFPTTMEQRRAMWEAENQALAEREVLGREGKVQTAVEIQRALHAPDLLKLKNDAAAARAVAVQAASAPGALAQIKLVNAENLAARKLVDAWKLTQPVDSIKSMMQTAAKLVPKVENIRAMAVKLDTLGLFGPVMARVRKLAEGFGQLPGDEWLSFLDTDPDGVERRDELRVAQLQAAIEHDPELQRLIGGAVDPERLLGNFSADLSLLISGTARVHGGARGGGSIQMIAYMKAVMSDTSTLKMFLGRMDSVEYLLGNYSTAPGAPEWVSPPSSFNVDTYDFSREYTDDAGSFIGHTYGETPPAD